MLKNKRSFISYIMIISVLIMSGGVLCLLFIQSSLINNEMEHQAYDKLAQEIREAKRYIQYEKDGIPFIEGEFYNTNEDEDEHDEIFVFVRDDEGNLLSGNAPEKYVSQLTGDKKDFGRVKINGTEYFAMSRKSFRRDGTEPGRQYMVSATVSVHDMKTEYRVLWLRSYMVIGVVSALMFIFALALRKKIEDPVKELEQSIKRSCENLDFTEEISYDGPFRELDMLVKSNNNLYKRVQHELTRQREFNANVSHELRTPIAVMHAQCQLSREIAEKNGDTAMLESIEVFERQTSRMKGLIEQILRMSIIDSDEAEFDSEDVDLLDVVESVCDDMEYICDKDITFEYDLRPTIISANMNLIVIVVNNLVSNAIKYSNRGGCIKVSCGIDGEYYYIAVRDEGCGISKESRAKIFDSFYRENPVRSTEGYGLGLSQVMKIAQYYGGTVNVDSEENVGSTFTILLSAEKVSRK